jgi:hypothetical protein
MFDFNIKFKLNFYFNKKSHQQGLPKTRRDAKYCVSIA